MFHMKYPIMLVMAVAAHASGSSAPSSPPVQQQAIFRPEMFQLTLELRGTETPTPPKTAVGYKIVSGPNVAPDVRAKVLSPPSGVLIDDRRQ